jgi:hypothetical protein
MEFTRKEIERDVAPPQVWKHTATGKLYQVICVSDHTEREETLVTYRLTNNAKKKHSRPLDMFLDTGGPDGAYRFERVR